MYLPPGLLPRCSRSRYSFPFPTIFTLILIHSASPTPPPLPPSSPHPDPERTIHYIVPLSRTFTSVLFSTLREYFQTIKISGYGLVQRNGLLNCSSSRSLFVPGLVLTGRVARQRRTMKYTLTSRLFLNAILSS